MQTLPRLVFQVGVLYPCLSTGVLQGMVNYDGGNGDGHDIESLQGTTLTNQSIQVLFEGGNGDGHDVDNRLGTTLTNQSIQVLFEGRNGDGHDVDSRVGTTITNENIDVLFDGGNGDGHDVETRLGTTITNENIDVLFDGGNGDGHDVETRLGTTITNENIDVLFDGGNGDGHDVESRLGTTLTNQNIQVLFDGGNGDGFDVDQQSGLALIPVEDSDGDEMPDIWEKLYPFLDAGNPGDAVLDFDGDGMSNLDEYFADTNPGDPSSVFCIDIRPDGVGGREIFFDTSAARYYRLELSPDLDNWTFENLSFLGTGIEVVLPLPAGNSEEFGRVYVAPYPID